MSEKPDLTYEDAIKVVDSLQLNNTEWRTWGKRTDGERLALGIIILQKHMRGMSMRAIEADMGISLATCQRYKERALMSLQMPTVEQARREELERLDSIIEAVWPAVESGDKDAIASYMKVSERRAKLLGLDKPIQVESTVTEISETERELQMMIRQTEQEDAQKKLEQTINNDFQ